MGKYHKEAIRIIGECDNDRELLIRIAEDHPSAVVKAHMRDKWPEMLKKFYREGSHRKVDAINYVRNETGMGLKEAKEAVDAVAVTGWA